MDISTPKKIVGVLSISFLLVSLCSDAFSEDAVVKKYSLWLKNIGLSDVIKIDPKPVKHGNDLTLTVNAHDIERTLDWEATKNKIEPTRTETRLATLYQKLFTKLVSISSLPPQNVKLRVTFARDYCVVSIYEKIIAITDQKFTITEKELDPEKPELRIACALNFEAIERHNKITATSLNKAETSFAMVRTESAPMSVLEKYFTQRYGQLAGVELAVTTRSDNVLALVVRKLRGEVIRGNKYWEKLQLFAMLTTETEVVRTHLILDGQFGSGLLPPSDFGYVDMEPRYTSALREYGSALLVSARREINR